MQITIEKAAEGRRNDEDAKQVGVVKPVTAMARGLCLSQLVSRLTVPALSNIVSNYRIWMRVKAPANHLSARRF